jgi:hypothetical protein
VKDEGTMQAGGKVLDDADAMSDVSSDVSSPSSEDDESPDSQDSSSE